MATAALTDTALRKLKPPKSGRLEIWDSLISEDRTLPGTFGIRVTSNGTRSWMVMFRILDAKKGKVIQKRHKLGEYPSTTLKEARIAAREALTAVARGKDPAQAQKAAMDSILGGITLTDAVAQFIAKYAKKENRGWKETERIFDKYVKPDLGDFRLEAITRADVRNVLDGMVDTPYMANRTLAAISKFYNWAVERELATASPVAGLKKTAPEKSRDRALDESEIKAVWNAFNAMGWPFGLAFRLMLVTGQRRNEVAQMKWKDLNLKKGIWSLPREATKADRAHEVPLSPLALEVLNSVHKTSKKYVFSTTTTTPISGFSQGKNTADKTIAIHKLEAMGQDKWTDKQLVKAMLPDWRLHDLRRTVATEMAKLKVAPHVIEKVLNHSTGQISGVAGVYNRYAYLDEKQAALNTWARKLESIVKKSETGNVVEMRKG